jgi:hypothetical protein
MLKDEKFNRDWASLMAVCVSNGIKIKIIHNIERNLSEMTEAIEAWLPLYMAGTIEPYYCNKQNGNRFSHTMFICPDVAAITACLVKGTEDKGLYRYCTDEDELDYHINSFNTLLTDCEPLAHIKPGITADRTLLSNNNATQKIDLHNIRLEVNSNYVNVIKENAPSITFTFLHPFMCEAFESYIQTIHPES